MPNVELARPMPAPDTRKTEKPYHHGNLRAELLAAGIEAIKEHGVAELRLRDLARRVGVSHGAPANHFKDRADLLTALAVDGFERLADAQRQALEREHASPSDALIAIGVVYVQFAVDNPAHFEVMFQRDLLGRPEVMKAGGGSFQMLMGVVSDVRGKGEAPSDDNALGALGSWAVVHGLAGLHAQGLLPAAICKDVPGLAANVLAAMKRIAEGLPRE
jgi:AcrR family transcriptional regulator